MLMLLTGAVEGGEPSADIAAAAWEFDSINDAYRSCIEFAEVTLKRIRNTLLPRSQLRQILGDDRRRWRTAVRNDPLLPAELLPKPYQGIPALKVRRKLHASLLGRIDTTRHS